jgi:hypothetical protein
MGYLGNSNVVQNFTPAVDYFNGNGSATAFTLSRTVGSSFDIQAFIENVPQNPSSAFTVAGNIITFDSAPPSGTNNIYVRYTSPVVQQVKPAPGTVGPTELNSAYSLWNLSGANINYTAGNVGIGTVSPAAKLSLTSTGNTTEDGIRLTLGSEARPHNIYSDLSTGRDLLVAPWRAITLKAGSGTTEGEVRIQSYESTIISTGASYTERMRIASNGNVGIGTNSPSNPLHIVNSGANINLLNLIGTNTYTGTGLQGEGPFRLQNTNTTNGNMTSISNYDGNGNINTQLHFININQSGDGAIAFTTRTGGSYSERMRVTESGGTRFQCENYNAQPSSTNGGVEINNTNAGSTMFGFGTGTETHIAFGNRNGIRGTIQTTSGGTSYNTTSDYRLKENITPMTGALAKVAQLNPVTYNWKVGGSGQGFIAHELQEIVPDAVTGEKDAVNENDEPKYQMVDTSFLVATLTAAIQEQQAIIEDLKTRIEILENK